MHDGFFASGEAIKSAGFSLDLTRQIKKLSESSTSTMTLVLYPKTGMGDGQQANNPWLQEFPDPISRVSWDNYLSVSAKDAKKIGLKNVNVANGALNGSYGFTNPYVFSGDSEYSSNVDLKYTDYKANYDLFNGKNSAIKFAYDQDVDFGY